MGAGWRRFTERLHQTGPSFDGGFQTTSNARCRQGGAHPGWQQKWQVVSPAANSLPQPTPACSHNLPAYAA